MEGAFGRACFLLIHGNCTTVKQRDMSRLERLNESDLCIKRQTTPIMFDNAEQEEAANAAAETVRHPGNTPRFSRPDSDWLRKKAISAALRNYPVEPSVYSVPNQDGGRQTDSAASGLLDVRPQVLVDFTPARETAQRRGTQIDSGDAHELRQNSVEYTDDLETLSNYSLPHPIYKSRGPLFPPGVRDRFNNRVVLSPAHDALEGSVHEHTSFQGSYTPIKELAEERAPPTIRRGCQEVSPAVWRPRPEKRASPTISNRDDWLLPHPFKSKANMPSLGTNGESDDENCPQSPTSGRNDELDSCFEERTHDFGAEAPCTPTRRRDSRTPIRSPYFERVHRQPWRTGDGFDTPEISGVSDCVGISSSFGLPLTSSPRQSPQPAVTSQSLSALPSDPFITPSSGPDSLNGSRENSPQNRQEANHSARRYGRSGEGYTESYISPHGSTTSDGLMDDSTFHNALPSHRSTARSRGIRSQVTQTLTPQSISSSTPHPRGIRRSHDRHLHRFDKPDSSILSSLGREDSPGTGITSDTIPLRRPAQRDGNAGQSPDPYLSSSLFEGGARMRPRHSAYRDKSEPSSFRLLDLDLESDSESDHDDGSRFDPGLPHASKPQVGDGFNAVTSTESTQDDRVVCAISESRSSDVVGLAVINITTGRVEITRILNDDRYQRVIEALWRMASLPQTFLVLKKVVSEQSKSLLAQCLKTEFPDAEIVPLDRQHWNESEGLRMIDRFAWRTDVKATRSNLEHNFYASCAFSAVMAFVEKEMSLIFRENSLHVKYIQPVNTMGLDRSTVTALEILQNLRQAKSTSSTLFGLLNHTLTPQGRRLLRSTLLQPSTDKDVIVARHEAVEELSCNEALFMELRGSLKKLLRIDIERSIPWIALPTKASRLSLQDGVALIEGHHQIAMASHEELQGAEKDLNNVLMIKEYIVRFRGLRDVLEAADCTSQLLKSIVQKCSPDLMAPITALIEETIEQQATYSKAPIDIRNNRMWAVKAPAKSVLEEARQLYQDRTNDLHDYMERLSQIFQEQLGATPELRLANNNHYYLRFQWSDVEREVMRCLALADNQRAIGTQHWRQRSLGGVEIVNASRRKHHYHFQTIDLIQMSSQIQRQADIVTAQSDKVITELKTALLDHVECLLAMSEATAMLDMLASFVQLATTQNYVRPIISDNLVLKAARNPIAELRKTNFVSNDVYLGEQDIRFQLITGGNMSGKSTFIKAVAMIQIMSQIGSFVPAQYAAIPICDRLFTRLSTEDRPESNLGTFAVEMTEMNMILRQATRDSFVVIDELGRGTSTKEGLAIALAMSEKLIKRGCRVFFATHFTELAKVLNATNRNSVLNVHLTGESIRDGDTLQISLPHTVASGPIRNEDYGLDLARRYLPARVVNNAEQICKFLRERQASKVAGPATRVLKQNKLVLALPDLLKQAYNSIMDDSALASYLKKLQTEFTIRMNTVSGDIAEVEGHGRGHQLVEHPILEKLDEADLQAWKKKCEEAEKRVMHANMAHSQNRKRPAVGDEGENDPRKRMRADTPSEPVSTPTPINRSSIIEKLRREANTPSNREDSPSSSSVTMEIQESIMEDSLAFNEGTPQGSTSGNPEKHYTAVSITSDESPHGSDDEVDLICVASDKTIDSELPEIRQPLQQFQPLKNWYDRQNRNSNAAGTESHGFEPPRASGISVRSRSQTRDFLHGLDED